MVLTANSQAKSEAKDNSMGKAAVDGGGWAVSRGGSRGGGRGMKRTAGVGQASTAASLAAVSDEKPRKLSMRPPMATKIATPQVYRQESRDGDLRVVKNLFKPYKASS